MEEDFTRYLTAASRRISEAHKPPIDAREWPGLGSLIKKKLKSQPVPLLCVSS